MIRLISTEDAPFLVDVRRDGAAVIVAPRGDVDLATVSAVRHAIAEAGPVEALVLDLRGVDFLDTSGLQLVLEQRRRAEQEGFRLVLVRGHAGLQRLFEIAGMTSALTFVDDPAEARADGEPQAG
jgi:anti-anti-sigma factor